MDLPLSWHTDIAVLVGSGSAVEEHADHLVVRTPANPTYAWGNFVMVIDPATVDDAARWEAVFASCFPDAGHRAVGLPVPPADVPAWQAAGMEIEREDVLSATSHWSGARSPRGTPCGRWPATTTGSGH